MARKYSVIIPTLNRPDLLRKCVLSLAKQSVLPYEIVVVDQSDDDRTKKAFEEIGLASIKKRYIHSAFKGLTRSRNIGIDACSKEAELMGFLDDDMEVQPNYYELLLARFAENPKFLGGMGTVVGLPGQPFEVSFLERIFFLPHFGDGRFMPNGLPTLPHKLSQYSDKVEFLSGGMALFKAEVLKKHKYDENLIGFGHGDDWDITYRISREGPLFFEPSAQLFHPDGAPGKDQGSKHRREQLNNAFYLVKKNKKITPLVAITFFLYVLGNLINDLSKRRLSAVKGDLAGTALILRSCIVGRSF